MFMQKKLALHCIFSYFCPQFEINLFGNVMFARVLECQTKKNYNY